MPEFTRLARRPSVGSPTPWGLAQSVEEIAVSIVAELVAVRRKGAITAGAKNFIPGGKP